MARVVVIGAGPMGLAAAHRAVTLGHQVDLVEADAKAGGMAAHFDFGGVSIERFYHFCCLSDQPTFDLMEELGLGGKMRWVKTSMSYYMGGKVHRWGDPVSLLRFPHLSLWEKLRYGLQVFVTTRKNDFNSIEPLTSREWIERGAGRSVYAKLWKRLQDLKFYEYADRVSASWIATRIRRIGRSRAGLFEERLGYIEGGSETLVEALAEAIVAKGGQIHLKTPAERIVCTDGRVSAVQAGGRLFPADHVISTIPTPLISALVPDLPATARAMYDDIDNIGCVCVLLRLRRSVSPHFWMNIVDPSIDIPGIIEFSNLRPLGGDAFVYVPYYMPTSQPKWTWSDASFVEEAFGYIKVINPQLTDADLVDARVGRLKYAQPVCEPNFREKLPPVQTDIDGLQIADTCFYYPEDRGIAESIRFGRRMAEAVS